MADEPSQAESQADKKASKPVAATTGTPAAPEPVPATSTTTTKPVTASTITSSVDTPSSTTASSTTPGTDSAINKKPVTAKTETSSPSKTSPSVSSYVHPTATSGAPVLPPVPMHHPYAHHHYYAYHHNIAAANAVDPKKTGKSPNPVAPYTSAQYKKLGGAGGDVARAKKGVSPGPQPPHYPPPPPGVPPHPHAYHAWAAYRYAQHPHYHGGPPPGHHGWNEAYAASHQVYAASKATAAKGTKVSEHGATATGTGVAGSGQSPPPHHHYPHSGSPSAGPYRYSDPTLRREALSRLNTPDNKSNTSKSGSPPTPVSSSTKSATNNHSPSDPATLHMLELEARAEGATSPSQIEDFHREEVTTMGCTCKKTKCLKLYCQCFAVKIYCGANCRCLSCRNSVQYEIERKDAIRAILSRNPTAFDTKFQKNHRNSGITQPNGVVGVPTVLTGGANARVSGGGLGLLGDIPHARTISHKLGCKCRKSACVKKYCECYAGNVKCSSNCRCVGCKNRPPGGFGGGGSGKSMNTTTPTKSSLTTPVKKEPSWMMNAAQNLVSRTPGHFVSVW